MSLNVLHRNAGIDICSVILQHKNQEKPLSGGKEDLNGLSKMRFDHLGRTRQLRIRNAEGLAQVVQLNEALWIATSAPTNTFRVDEAFLNLLDKDRDGRIHASELKRAIQWTLSALKDTSGIEQRSSVLKLASIDETSEEGRRAVNSIKRILLRLGSPAEQHVHVDQIRKIKSQVEKLPVSELGVVIPDATHDEDLRRFIEDVVATMDGVEHPSGKRGLEENSLTDFVRVSREFLNWQEQGRLPEGLQSTSIMPLGARTSEAFKVLEQLRGKLDQYFAQCRAVQLNPKILDSMPPTLDQLQNTDFSDEQIIADMLKDAPLAKPNARRALDFTSDINPFYQSQAELFRNLLLSPEDSILSEQQWTLLKETFSAYENWLHAKPHEKIGDLGTEKIGRYLEKDYASAVKPLLNQSRETAIQLDDIRHVEKLALFQAFLLDFANNFVSFPDLYMPDKRAAFEMGSLVMDGRWFNLSVKVENRAEHAAIAQGSNTFILYVQIANQQNSEPYEVAIPVTSGGKGNLVVGKRGIFHDIAKREWDARVVHIIENPISLREAVTAPFRKIGDLITGKIEQITSLASKRLETATQEAVKIVKPGTVKPPEQPQPLHAQNRGLMTGSILAGGGVAIAALSSSLAYVSQVIATQGIRIILGGIGVAFLAILIPTVILAYLKLRSRDLSALLEASGWAINARMRLTRHQCRFFTQKPRYPGGLHPIP